MKTIRFQTFLQNLRGKPRGILTIKYRTSNNTGRQLGNMCRISPQEVVTISLGNRKIEPGKPLSFHPEMRILMSQSTSTDDRNQFLSTM